MSWSFPYSPGRLRGWLPANTGSRQLIAASFIDSVGTGLYLAGSVLFFTRVLGLSAVQVGVGLSLSGLAGVLGIVPFGRFADRIGGTRAIVGLYAWRGLCFLALPFVQGALEFYLVAVLIGVAEWAGGPVIQGIVGALEGPQSRVRTMAVIATVRNTGFTVGAVLATVTVAVSHRPAGFTGLVICDAVTFLVAAALLSRLPGAQALLAAVKGRAVAVRPSLIRVHDPRFLALTALNGILYLHSVLLTVALPLWIATRTSAPATLVGVIVVINTILAITLQVPLSDGSTDLASAAKRQNWTGWCLAACCGLVALTVGAPAVLATALIVAATVVMTLAEIWQSVSAWRLSYALSPEDQRASYLSVYELGKGTASAAGPALLTWAVIENGAAGWLGLGGFFLLSGFAVVLISRSLSRAGQEQCGVSQA